MLQSVFGSDHFPLDATLGFAGCLSAIPPLVPSTDKDTSDEINLRIMKQMRLITLLVPTSMTSPHYPFTAVVGQVAVTRNILKSLMSFTKILHTPFGDPARNI